MTARAAESPTETDPAETLRRLEVAALLRLGLGTVAGRAVEAGPDETVLDALRRLGALSLAQVIAARAYLERNRIACACGRVVLADDGGEARVCSRCGATIARSTRGGGDAAKTAPVARARLAVGERLGPFELLSELGRGANGRVFRARHVELGRIAALKIVPGAALDATRRRRFEREVVAQARLAHPGIVGIHSSLAVLDALAFEMELVEGESLRARLDRERALPWRTAARIVAETARAVEHVHAQGIVHRDLKPANIMLRAADGSAVVADLGIARFMDQASSLTQEGALVGSPAYMAPEAIGGEAGPKADVYSLGVTLYEAIAGEVPFEENQLVRLLYRISTGQCAPLPSTRAPAALEAIRVKAMAVDPRARHASAGQLAAELEALVGGDVPDVLPTLGPPRSRAVTLAAVLLAAAAPLIVLALALSARARPEQREAEARALLESVSRLTDSEPARALELLHSLDPRSAGARPLVPEIARLELRLGEARRALGALGLLSPPERARQARTEAQARRALGDLDAALAILPRTGTEGSLAVTLLLELGRAPEAETLALELSRAQGPERFAGLLALGEARLALHDLIGARSAFLDAQRFDPRGVASAGLAEVFLAIDAPEDALPLAEAAVRAAPREPWAHLVRAGARLRAHDLPRALADIQTARALGPSLRACLEGRALARDLASHVPHGAWAQAFVREARRASLEAIEWPLPEVAQEANATGETIAAAFSASASAHVSLGIGLLLQPSGTTAALTEADAAIALDPTDALAMLLRGHVLAMESGYAAGLAVIDGISEEDDHEARVCGLLARSLEPGVYEQSRVDFAAGAHDLVKAKEGLARGKAHAELRQDRSRLLELESGIARAEGDTARAAALELERGWLEPWRAEARASLLREQTKSKADIAARVQAEPWEPAHHAVRFIAHVQQPILHDLFDQFAAAAMDIDYAPRAFAALLQSDEMTDMRHKLAEKDFDPIKNLSSLALENLDPERVALPKQTTHVGEAAVELCRASLALSGRDALGWPPAKASLHALEHVRLAENAHIRTPLVHAFRALALEQLDARLAAARERNRFARVVPPVIDAVFECARRRYLPDPKTTDAAVMARLRDELDLRRAAAEHVPVEDLHGYNKLSLALGMRLLEIPSRARVSVPEATPARPLPRGWMLDSRSGEAHLTGFPPTDPLELEIGGDVIAAELLESAETGRLIVAVPGARFEIETDRPEIRRETISLVAGVPRPERARLTVEGAPVTITCFFARSRISLDEEKTYREDIERAFRFGPSSPRSEKMIDEAVAKGQAPSELAWQRVDSGSSLADLTPEAAVETVFSRLLGRAPSALEKATWLERLKSSDRSLLPRAIGRSAEFRARFGG